MRKALSIGLAAFLMASPAMAQVVIGGDNDAARHEQRAQQDRMQAHRDFDRGPPRCRDGPLRCGGS